MSAIPAATPGPPTALLATAHDSSVQLDWSAPGDDGGAAISDYRIEQSTDGGASWQIVDDGIGTTPSALVNGLANETEYWFRVSAMNAIGAGAASAIATATPNP